MNISGKINVFKHIKENVKNGNTFSTFSTNINRKEEDGTYTKWYAEVKFAGDLKDVPEKLEENICYVINVEDGFLSFNDYDFKYNVGKQENIKKIYIPVLIITKGHCESQKEIKSSSPF